MASQVLFTFTRFGAAITRSRSNINRIPIAYQARHVQFSTETGATDAIKRGINDAMRTGENLKNNVSSNTEHVFDKAKESAQEAWESTKETAQKAKDTVIGNAQESKESLKETAEIAKRSMNTKNNPNC
ncbi:hypothetical protein Dimus_021545 [Dionaea muscipula]